MTPLEERLIAYWYLNRISWVNWQYWTPYDVFVQKIKDEFWTKFYQKNKGLEHD